MDFSDYDACLVRRVRSNGIRAAVFLLSLLGALSLGACAEPVPGYRYRMTVEVDTPEGLRTGSSVIEVRVRVGSGLLGPESRQVSGKVIGEAVAVDLGPRGTLFALLEGPINSGRTAGGYAGALLPNPPARGGDIDAMRENYRALGEAKGSADLTRDRYPMLVRFRNILDPLTVEEVDPSVLSAAFGQGVSLRRIFVEITHDEPNLTITGKLPWLSEHPEPSLESTGRGTTTPTFAQMLTHGAFKSGFDD